MSDENKMIESLGREEIGPVRLDLLNASRPENRREIENTRFMQIKSLRKAIHDETFLRVVPTSVEHFPGPTEAEGYYALTCYLEPVESQIKVVIPYSEVFQIDPMVSSPVSRLPIFNQKTADSARLNSTRPRNILEKHIGNRLVVIPREIIETDTDLTYVYCSRKEASRILRRISYIDEPRRIQAGGMYNATIMSVSRNSVTIMLGGLEKTIPKYYVTDRYVENFTSPEWAGIYRPGKQLPVIVQSVVIKDGDVKAELDLLGAEVLESQKRLPSLIYDQSAICTISKIIGKGDSRRIIGWIEGMNIPTILTNVSVSKTGLLPKEGDRVYIRIKERRKDGYIYATMRDLISETSLY